jgi:type IV pilus assembly protein PilC
MASNVTARRVNTLTIGGATEVRKKAQSASQSRIKRVPGARKIRVKELPGFTRQLAAMLNSGMPVVHCLNTLEDQTINKSFKTVITGLRSQIEGGLMLSESLAAYPEVFDELFVNMFRAGETGGMLAETAGRIAAYLEANGKLRRKVKSAMMYPTIVMAVALLLAVSMIVWIVPVFANIYSDFGAKLPGPTQVLVNISNAVRHNFVVVAAGFVGLGFLLAKWKKSAGGAYQWDGLCLRFPVIGDLVRKVALARFASTFAQLMKSGVPILKALDIVAFATGNKVLGKIILDARATVERGEPLSGALEKSKQYPRMLINMLSAGEKTGKVDEMLQRISEFYDDEVQAMLSGLTSLIEPLLMVFLGVVIGGIVVCMFLPIFKMHEIINF